MLEFDRVPISGNVFLETSIAAVRVATAPVRLVLCTRCATLHNATFSRRSEDPTGYEKTRGFNQRLRSYTDALSTQLVRSYDLESREVIEIGCGQGNFLAAIARRCRARCLGFDQRLPKTETPRQLPNLRLVADDYSPMRYEDCHADLVISRNTLDHVTSPRGFLSDLRYALKSGGRFFIEVPNATNQLDRKDVWDVSSDRSTYFTAPALARLLRSAGLEPDKSYTSLGGQMLCVEGRLRTPSVDEATKLDPAELNAARSQVQEFAREFERQILMWNDLLAARIAEGDRIAVWGAGSRGVTFLNVVGGGREVAAVVDLNERKHDRFVPGTAQRIVAPESLRTMAIDTIVVVNVDYRTEIAAQLRDLGLRCDIITL